METQMTVKRDRKPLCKYLKFISQLMLINGLWQMNPLHQDEQTHSPDDLFKAT